MSTFFEVFFGWEGELGGDELEAASLETGEDFADETAVDAIGLFVEREMFGCGRVLRYLDHDVGAFVDVGCHD